MPDCWRFTEHGIRLLLSDFKTIEIKALENENRFLMPYHYTTVAKINNEKCTFMRYLDNKHKKMTKKELLNKTALKLK